MCVRARPSARAPPPAVDAHLLHQQDLLHPPHPLHPPSQAAHKATLEDKKALIDKVDCFIFDCDGVIWRGDSVIEGVPETLDMLRAKVGVPGRGGGGGSGTARGKAAAAAGSGSCSSADAGLQREALGCAGALPRSCRRPPMHAHTQTPTPSPPTHAHAPLTLVCTHRASSLCL